MRSLRGPRPSPEAEPRPRGSREMQERLPIRAGSEPPQEASTPSGLRRPHVPIRLAGVTMGGSIGSGLDIFGVAAEQSCAAPRPRCASGAVVAARNGLNGLGVGLSMPFGSVAASAPATRKCFGGGLRGRRSSSVENIVRMLEALNGNCEAPGNCDSPGKCDSPDSDFIAVEPEQVNYHGPRPAPIIVRCPSTDGIMEDLTTAEDAEDCTSLSCSSSKVFEELFVAVDSEEEESVALTSDLANQHEDQSTPTAAIENIAEEITECENPIVTPRPELMEFLASETDESVSESVSTSSKLALKRQRNLTMDFHDLAPSVWTTYNGQVAKYTQKVYLRADEEAAETETQHSEDSLGLGLGIILDKLKNIEIKLDEIKALEENNGVCTIVPMDSMAEGGKMDLVLRDKSCNTSPCSLRTTDSNEVSAVVTSAQGDSATCIAAEMIETADDEFTLVEENDSVVSECSHTEVVQQLESDQDSDKATVSSLPDGVQSPISETASDSAKKENRGGVTITSAASSSSAENNDDGEDKYDSESRMARIERLAAQFLKPQQAPPPPEPSSGLETLSERSEDEREAEPPAERRRVVTVTRRRSRRTRSSSRDRALAKIRFCWRCHQTGHESFDCEAKLHPGNWCPRCLEDSHWEDDCWVSHKQVLCSRCTLPGHLPCVHETSDFRQRKLIIETFGWLAFKDWFRDPDFWSWWNVSGFTNVPLYKLMQQCRR